MPIRRLWAIFLVIGLLVAVAVSVGLSLQSAAEPKGSGPISTFPADWLNPCRLPVHGNTTTENEVVSTIAPGLANFSLSQVYDSTVGSSSFRAAAGPDRWVTGSWSLVSFGDPSGTSYYVHGTFILLSGGRPDGYVTADYYNVNGTVKVSRETSLVSFGCPAAASSSTGVALDRGTPAYYPLGQPVKVIFEVNNSASESLSFSTNSSCLGRFDVYGNVSGTYSAVYHSLQHGGCGASPLSVVLKGGTDFAQAQEWDQTYDNGTRVPAGVYRVEANVSATGIGSLTNSGGDVYLGTPVATDSAVFHHNFAFTGRVRDGFVSLGTPVRLDWFLEQSGSQIYDLQTSQCSFRYIILNITNAVVYDSLKRSSCGGGLTDDPLPPQGILSKTLYWNGTNALGGNEPPGFYRAVLDLTIFSGGRAFNASEMSDFLLEKPGPAPDHFVTAESSSFCTSGCPDDPSLSAHVYANGNLKDLELYVNGTYAGTTRYSLPCCQFTYSINLNASLANTPALVPGNRYDVVLIGTFSDGESSVSWMYPVVPAA